LASLGASCVIVEDVAFVLREPAGGPPGLHYSVELFRGGSCPSALDAITGTGSGGVSVERRSGTRDALGAFASIEEGDYVVIALGRDSACVPVQFGCAMFRAGDGNDVVVTLGDTGWPAHRRPCTLDTHCDMGACAPNTGTCTDLAPMLPSSCVSPDQCGPTHAFDCTGMTCTPGFTMTEVGPLDITRGAEGEVVGERFALTEEGTEFVHVLAAVQDLGSSARSLNIWTADPTDLASGTVQSADTSWMVDEPYAVAARDYAGTVYAAVYHQQQSSVALHVGLLDGTPMGSTEIVGSTPRSGFPAFTGTGERIRQFWFGEIPGADDELASLDRGGSGESARFFTNTELPDLTSYNEIIGSKGDYALLLSRTPETYFIAYSDPESAGGRMMGTPGETHRFPGITGRPAFVHIENDRYALMYPAGRNLVVRYATCVTGTCTFDATDPPPVEVGWGIDFLRAEALRASDVHAGFAVTYMRVDCSSTPLTELLLLDTDLVPRFQAPVEYDQVLDVELAVVQSATGWRIYVAWLRESDDFRDIWLTAFDF
jgi:hypothetical protein